MPRKMKNKAAAPTGEPPAKRTKLLSDDEDSDVEISNGVALAGGDSLKINEDFAKRFEHNEKRKERERRTSILSLSDTLSSCSLSLTFLHSRREVQEWHRR